MFGPFNRQSGASPEEVNWEGWTPPWMEREGRGPCGPFGHRHGFGGHFGPGHGWWHHGGHGQHWGVPDELLALRAEAAEVARLFAIASRGAFENKERLSQLRALLDRSRKELSDMIYGSAQSQTTGEGKSASSSPDIEQA
ncbi:MAG: hypothetical protein LAP86_15315 [Acidobacteriia bacterium]|nr:hypothetical protein [Terriglobia bacterium]